MIALLPPWMAHVGAQLYSGLGLARWWGTGQHGSVSFIEGMPETVFCAGAEVVGMHVAEPLLKGQGLAITVIVHGDVMDLSVSVCPDNVPYVDDLATGIAEGVGVLLAAAEKSPRGRGQSVVTEMTSHYSKRSRV